MLTDDEIREICDRYELIYNITDNVVFIRSACGRWNIFLRGDEVVNLLSRPGIGNKGFS